MIGAEHVLVPSPPGSSLAASPRTRPNRRIRRGAVRDVGWPHVPLPHPEVEVPGRRSFLHGCCHVAPPGSLPIGSTLTKNEADSALYLCFTTAALTPTARLLELLELLQTQPLITGREIPDHLEIDPRTVPRYVEALQDLGIPVEGQRGVGGGYRIRPGYRLPVDADGRRSGCRRARRVRGSEARALRLGRVGRRRAREAPSRSFPTRCAAA